MEPLRELLQTSRARVWLCASFVEDPVGQRDMLAYAQIAMKKSVWIAAPGDSIPDPIRRSVDYRVVVAGMTSHCIAAAAQALTGTRVDVKYTDWAGLDLGAVAAVLQAAPSADEIAKRLQREVRPPQLQLTDKPVADLA